MHRTGYRTCRDPSATRRQASRNWMFRALHTMRLRERLMETESALGVTPPLRVVTLRR
jgi:hypothetical protein